MLFGSYAARMAEHFSPKKKGLHAGSWDCPWAVYGLTWDCVAQSRKLFWIENVHVKLLDVIVENWDCMVEIPRPVLDNPGLKNDVVLLLDI